MEVVTTLTALHREWALALLTLKKERQILARLLAEGADAAQLDDQHTRVLAAEQAATQTRTAYQSSFASPGKVVR